MFVPGDLASAMLLGVTSMSVSPAPLPYPDLGLATALASPALGLGLLQLLVHAKPEKAHAWGSAAPKQPSKRA